MPVIERLIHTLVVSTVLTILFAFANGTLFVWHPILMSMAFLGLMAEGVLTALKVRRYGDGQTRVNKLSNHMHWQGAAWTVALCGAVVIITNKACSTTVPPLNGHVVIAQVVLPRSASR